MKDFETEDLINRMTPGMSYSPQAIARMFKVGVSSAARVIKAAMDECKLVSVHLNERQKIYYIAGSEPGRPDETRHGKRWTYGENYSQAMDVCYRQRDLAMTLRRS